MITKLSFKKQDGTFTPPVDLGAYSNNVRFSEDGKNLDEKLLEYAVKDHSSTTTEFGAATAEKYGHVKISDDYEGNDSETAVSQAAISALVEKLQSLMNSFRVLNENTDEAILFSSMITGYLSDEDKGVMELIPEFFDIEQEEPPGSGKYILVVK